MTGRSSHHPANDHPHRPVELLWLVLFLTVAAILRLYQLGDTPFHHDESAHAYLSYLLWEGHPYRFDPVFHGPFLYWGNALVYTLLGAEDWTARLLPALFSIAMLLPLWMLRERLGPVGWKVAAAFMVLSPTFTYYGRFLAHDNYCTVFTLLLLSLGLGYRQRPAAWRMAAMGLLTGLFLATKAVSYIHLGIFAIFGLLVLSLDSLAPRWPRRWLWQEALGMWRRGRMHLWWGLLALLLAYGTLYSSFFSHWRGIWDGVYATLAYWGGQQAEPRIPGPAYYYLPRLLLHEPVFWLAVPALVWVGRSRERPFDLFLAYWTIMAFAIYGLAQEKVPWLLMHVLTPMLLLAGRWADHLWRGARSRARLGLLGVALLSWSLRDTLWLAFQMPPATPHLLTYMATSQSVVDSARRILDTPPAAGQVFLTGPATWPLAWYLRERESSFSLPQGWEKTAMLVVADARDADRIAARGFTGRTDRLMTWWYPDLLKLFGPGLLPYLIAHRSGPDFGEYRYSVLERRPAPRSAEQTSE